MGWRVRYGGLNAPYGAWCFLTMLMFLLWKNVRFRLNAPYGARCFLTADNIKYLTLISA